MEDLIWFSMPGAVLAVAIVVMCPAIVDTEAKAIILAVLMPGIGFSVDQIFRLIFEWTGGYARKSRTVLLHIMNVLAPRENIALSELKKAFLVWEITFYEDEFPAAFRDHDRGSWHYILSFWSISLAAALAFVFAMFGLVFLSRNASLLLVALAELGAALVFYFKGKSTYNSLVRQEVAVVHNHEGLFLETLRKTADILLNKEIDKDKEK